ncbi:hypothetical protein FQN49_008424 [Arthroderma sp. PD_2]|nr:hypothetical protein FQN49_008424 [Arthroderma sp. PD_2]
MLNISPFTYGMSVAQIYDDGQTFDSSVLDIEEDHLLSVFQTAINNVASVSLATNFPTMPSVIHSIVNTYKKCVAIGIETEYSWEAIEELKDRIANPDAYAAAGPAVTESKGDKPKEEAKAEEEEEDSEEEDGGFGDLFG